MFGLFRFIGYFIFSTLILSIPINSKPLFYSVQKYSTPLTYTIIQKLNILYSEFIGSQKNDNNIKSKIDQITSSLSSTRREEYKKSPDFEKRKTFFKTKSIKHHQGHSYTEKEKLKEILERE